MLMVWLVAAEAGPAAGPSTWLYLFAALLAGGLLQVCWEMYRRWRRGPRDDALQIARAAQEQSASSAELWTKYRVELEDAKAQLNQYLKELIAVNRELGAATGRIAKLEQELHEARSDAKQLRGLLAEAVTRRDDLIARMSRLQERIHQLETGNGSH